MSAGKNDIVKTMDPRLDLSAGYKMNLQEGARIVGQYNRPATSKDSSGIQFDNINPGSTGFVVDRKMYVNSVFNIRVTPTNDVGGRPTVTDAAMTDVKFNAFINGAIPQLGLGLSFGPRPFPLTNFTNNLQVVINGETYSYEVGRYWDVLARYSQSVYDPANGDFDLTPSMQDTTVNFGVDGLPAQNIGYAVNPLISYGSNSSRSARGAFIKVSPFAVPTAELPADGTPRVYVKDDLSVSITRAGNVYTIDYFIIRLDVTEPIMIPLLAETIGKDYDSRGLYGINELRINMTFSSNINKLICGAISPTAGADKISSVAYSFNPDFISSANLYYNILTPKMLPNLPESNVYSDERIKLIPQKVTVKDGDISLSVVSSNLSVGSVPSRVYMWLSTSVDAPGILDTQTYATIKKLDFLFNNQNTQFNNASPQQLFLLAKRNGLTMDYQQFSQFVGAPMCIDFARDVSLQDGDYPGRIGNYNFNYSATFDLLKPGDATKSYFLYTMIVEKGYTIIQNQVASRIGGIAQVDPNSLPLVHMDGCETMMLQDVYGGALKDTLVKYGKKAAHAAHAALPYIEKGLDLGKKALPYAATLLPLLAAGAGVSQAEAKQILRDYGDEQGLKVLKKMAKGGQLAGAQRVGGAKKKSIKAGAKTSKAAMKKQMSVY